MKTRTVIIAIVILTAFDQIAKLIVYHNFMEIRFDIIPGWLGFQPVFNYQYSYVNGLSNTGVGFVPHILLYIAICILMIVFYGYLKTKTKSRIVDYAFILALSGGLSAILSISFWEGVLDFIRLTPFFVVDPKDLYIDAFVVLFIIFGWKNHTANLFSGKDIAGYLKSCFRSFRR